MSGSSSTPDARWQFWIDVGGTFTDCVARGPDGTLLTSKVLSSAATKGAVHKLVAADGLVDPLRAGDAGDFWRGYELRILDADGGTLQSTRIAQHVAVEGRLTTADPIDQQVGAGAVYELRSHEEAPILAIRKVLSLRLDQPLPDIDVRLGTTRGTNALLERKGARTAFITTRGFADVLLIANQDRPRLFDLAITKPAPLFTSVIEIDERLDADGNELRPVRPDDVRRQLHDLRKTGVESIAICLLHAFANPAHEELVEQLAQSAGFTEISRSSRLSPLIKIVSRGDTTTVDAYLNPILRRYVESLRQSLSPASSLRLMTSAGGLVDADRFVGKDSILSGPAGGVIGFSQVAQQAGFAQSIGFDMGGTSTDVARFGGRYELEFETRKAGVRVVAPMLAIETVAAGGGSICRFDGVKLVVGPDSAGSDPGPACYGRGGPLTVTDVNLALGRILPSRFPFPLDQSAVARKLHAVLKEMENCGFQTDYTPESLAQGFVDIANANMARAIRRISVARGYDPADHTLVTFGGAGAQHACALAKLLGISRILVHPYAGVLSAFGMGLADVRRHAEFSVLAPLNAETLASREPRFADAEQQLRQEVRAEGIDEARIEPPVRALELRYQGVESTILVPQPADGDFAAAYERLHEQLYGYRHSGRTIDVAAARVEVVGKLVAPELPAMETAPRRPQARESSPVWFGGQVHDAAVFVRSELQGGDQIDGPAVICEPTSTVVVDPDFTARILTHGEILIEHDPTDGGGGGSNWPNREGDAPAEPLDTTAVRGNAARREPRPPNSRTSSPPDPVRLEIFNNLFASIAEQMGVTLQKTSISTNVKERLDFSCALFDPLGGLVCNAPHIPVHLGAMSETVRAILEDNPGMRPGDVFVTNDPYRGGSHLPDVTVVTPVFADDGSELLFFTASRAHHAEIGGIVPGSMPPFSSRLSEEGVLIRNFKLVDGGRSREDELRTLLTGAPFPTRKVADNLSDVSAQVAANAVGARLLTDLVARYSRELVQSYMRHIQQAAATKMRRALAALSDGVYAMTDHLDNGATIAVSITIDGETATVDFTGTAEVLDSNLNANRAIVTAAVLYVFRCMIQEDIPLNDGVLEPVEIVLPECLLNPPAHDDPAECAAIVGGNVETSQRVVDVLLGALRLAAASQGTMNNLTFGDDTFGYYETICGGSGATADAPGAGAVHTHMTNTRLTDAEIIERRYPIRVHEFSIRRDSGGAGAQPGGDGIVRRLQFLRPLKVSMLSQRRGEYAPFGLDGGHDGERGRNTLRRNGETVDINLGGCFQIDVQPGDILTITTPGGGGWGTPGDASV